MQGEPEGAMKPLEITIKTHQLLRGGCGALLLRGLGFGIEPLLHVVIQQLLERELLACTIIRFAHAIVRTMHRLLLHAICEFNY